MARRPHTSVTRVLVLAAVAAGLRSPGGGSGGKNQKSPRGAAAFGDGRTAVTTGATSVPSFPTQGRADATPPRRRRRVLPLWYPEDDPLDKRAAPLQPVPIPGDAAKTLRYQFRRPAELQMVRDVRKYGAFVHVVSRDPFVGVIVDVSMASVADDGSAAAIVGTCADRDARVSRPQDTPLLKEFPYAAGYVEVLEDDDDDDLAAPFATEAADTLLTESEDALYVMAQEPPAGASCGDDDDRRGGETNKIADLRDRCVRLLGETLDMAATLDPNLGKVDALGSPLPEGVYSRTRRRLDAAVEAFHESTTQPSTPRRSSSYDDDDASFLDDLTAPWSDDGADDYLLGLASQSAEKRTTGISRTTPSGSRFVGRREQEAEEDAPAQTTTSADRALAFALLAMAHPPLDVVAQCVATRSAARRYAAIARHLEPVQSELAALVTMKRQLPADLAGAPPPARYAPTNTPATLALLRPGRRVRYWWSDRESWAKATVEGVAETDEAGAVQLEYLLTFDNSKKPVRLPLATADRHRWQLVSML